LTGLLAGLASSTALTLRLARKDGADRNLFAAGILLAITSNALFKTSVCCWVGAAELALRVGTPLLAACAAGLGLPWLLGQLDASAALGHDVQQPRVEAFLNACVERRSTATPARGRGRLPVVGAA